MQSTINSMLPWTNKASFDTPNGNFEHTITSNLTGTQIFAMNPETGDINFIFPTGTPIGTRFNVTVWIYNVTKLFGFQVNLVVDDTLLNITRAWLPTTDPAYVFQGQTQISLGPTFYDIDGDGVNERVLIGASIIGVGSFSGDGLLAIIELEIIYTPPAGTVSCPLNINNTDTKLLDTSISQIPATKVDGYYEYKGFSLPEIIVKNPNSGDNNFVFYTNLTKQGHHFNATVWAYNISDLFAYQVELSINDAFLNITNAWVPTWSLNWVFYGQTHIALGPNFYDEDYDGFTERVILGASEFAGGITFTGSGLLAIIEFEIIYEPTSGMVTTDLNINVPATFFLNSALEEMLTTKINGNYKYIATQMPPPAHLRLLVIDTPSGCDTGALDILGYNYTLVNPLEFTKVDLNQYNVLFVGWTPGDEVVNALFNRAYDIAAWVARGNGIVALSEYKEMYRWAWLPLWVNSIEFTAENVVITNPYHPVMANLTDSDLSYWSNSYHGYFIEFDPAWEPLATGIEAEHPITLAAMYGSGRIAITHQDPDFHLYYRGTEGAGKLLRNMIEWVTPPKYEHDISVLLNMPSFLSVGSSTEISTTIHNWGLSNETDVQLQIQINGDTVANITVPKLITGSFYTLNYSWSPTDEGIYNVTAYAMPVPGENYTINNKATKFVTVTTPIINPEEGQYANYLFTPIDTPVNETIQWMTYNITYVRYVTPYEINITIWQQDNRGYTYTSWIIVNVFNRKIVAGSSLTEGYYYFGWIETNITIGSSIKILDTTATVKGEETIEAAGTYIDCWIVEMTYYSGPYKYNYTWWYDKATGLWIGLKMINYDYPGTDVQGFLIDTNIPIGGALRIETDKQFYTRLETVMVTATYIVGKTPIENATVTIQVNYPNGSMYFVWTENTNANGTATFIFLIDENAPYGTYMISATAYKPGLDTRSAKTTFLVGYLEPKIHMWFEPPDVALVNFNTSIILHIKNIGNATAYNVTSRLTLPANLTIISANTTFTGIIHPDEEIVLIAIVTAYSPSRHVLTAFTNYTQADGTPMPSIYIEKTLAFAYHANYPVDLTEMTVVTTANQITINLTITNYGDFPVQATLIISAQHVATKLILRSSYEAIIINPDTTIEISLTIYIPSTAPSGDYLVQGILATGLPSEDGFTLTLRQEVVTI
jgi:hypothetical protein